MRTHDTDDALLTSDDPEAFGTFYARHCAEVEAYFARRVGRDQAADLTAETFVSALVSRRRYLPGDTPAVGWLYTIAGRRLVDFQRRGLVEMRTRCALTGDAALRQDRRDASADALGPGLEVGLLRHLPPEQRDALRARFAQDRDYSEIASHADTTEASVRQRVARGLNALRGPLHIYRAAQQLAREDRAYRFAGGHAGAPLSSVGPRDPLDCSSAASLLLMRAGVFAPGPAWLSGDFAQHWGEPGEGRYVTLCANSGHVWIEFALDSDHRERFDPTPRRLAPHSGWLGRSAAPHGTYTPRHWPGC